MSMHYPTPIPQCGKGHSLANRHSFRRDTRGFRICKTCEKARTRAALILASARRRLARKQRRERQRDAARAQRLVQKQQEREAAKAARLAQKQAEEAQETQGQQLLSVVQRLDAARLTFRAGIVTVPASDLPA